MESLMTMFLWGIFWSIVSIATILLWGWDIPKLVTDFVILFAVVIVPSMFISHQGYNDLGGTISFVAQYLTNFMNMMPSVMMGEIAGLLFAPIRTLLEI